MLTSSLMVVEEKVAVTSMEISLSECLTRYQSMYLFCCNDLLPLLVNYKVCLIQGKDLVLIP